MSEYIMDLRKVVGHRCLLQCGASVIVMNRQNQVLLQQRADNLCWGYHGGSVNLDEDVREAAKRELYEETGLIAHELILWNVFSGPQMHYRYPNGDEVSNIDIVFLCQSYSGQIKKQDEEVLDLKWFDIGHLPTPLFLPNQIGLTVLQKQFLNSSVS